MSKISLVFLLGILTAIMPSTGFSSGWKAIFYVLIGSVVSAVSLLLRREINSLKRALKGREHTITDSFVQNNPMDTHGRSGKGVKEDNVKHIIN